MLEILVLASLTRKIGALVEEKGHRSFGYKALAVALWFGGEIVGAILGAAMTGGDESATCLIYLMALLGAGAGALIARGIADGLPVVGPALTPAPAPVSTTLPQKRHVPGMRVAILGVVLNVLGPFLFCVPNLISIPLCLYVLFKAEKQSTKLVALAGMVVPVILFAIIGVWVALQSQ